VKTVGAVAESKAVNRRVNDAVKIANEMYRHQPDWVTFFREVLGVDGLVRRLFSSPEELDAFENTQQYAEIQEMLTRLRERGALGEGKEPIRIITVRIPKSLHESLRAEARQRKTSLNQLCVGKLLSVVSGEFAPAD